MLDSENNNMKTLYIFDEKYLYVCVLSKIYSKINF